MSETGGPSDAEMLVELGRWPVIRPGVGQYIYSLFFLNVFTYIGIGTIVYGFTAHTQDWGSRAPMSLFLIALGLLPSAYVLGMRVEVSGGQVSKIFLFGLLRETIPLDELAVNEKPEYSGVLPVSHARFMRANGRGAFSLYRSYMWRSSDVDLLLGLASQPWDPEASMKRQNVRLIAAVILVGIVGFILFVITLSNAGPNGSVLGVPVR